MFHPPRLLVGLLALWAATASAQEATVGDACERWAARLETADAELADVFCGALDDLEDRLARATATIDRLEAERAAAPPRLPSRAIVMVDSARGCPVGWTDVGRAEPDLFAGRFPVIAGIGIPEDVPAHRSIGGEAAVALTETELPSHRHDLPLGFARAPDVATDAGRPGFGIGGGRDQVAVPTRAGREQTERAGIGEAHENRPPFVGLYFCRLDR